MAEEINVRVKHKGMTLAEWNKSTVILMERELGVATDTGEVRVGNGTDKWSALPIIKGEKGDPLKVTSTTKNSQGDTIIKFDDGSSATVSKGDKGDSITVKSHKKDTSGNTIITFSDGSNITVDKGDSIKVESTSTDNQGNTLVKFSDGSSATIPKGDKGDPLKFEDLTQEQINQIKAQDVDLTNYATKDHKHEITDVNGLQDELDGKALKDHTHDDVYAKGVGVDSNGIVKFLKGGRWYFYNSSSSMGYAVALKDHAHEITDINGLQKELKTKASSTHYHDIEDINNLQTVLNGKASSTHTHDEYFKKGDPIELTPEQKAELKGAKGDDGTSVSIRSATQNTAKRVTTVTFSNGTSIEVPWGKDGTDGESLGIRSTSRNTYSRTTLVTFTNGDSVSIPWGENGEPGKQGNPGTPGRDGTSITTWVGTQSEYNRIYSKSSTTLYLIKG